MKLVKLIETRYAITGEIAAKDGTRSYGEFDSLEEATTAAQERLFNVFTIRRIDLYETILGKITINRTVVGRC